VRASQTFAELTSHRNPDGLHARDAAREQRSKVQVEDLVNFKGFRSTVAGDMPTISPTPSTNGHRPSGETSEARIAKALAHLRMLRDYDCVELVRTEPRRGALQHFYKATARPNLDEGQWRTLPSGLRRELTGETITELVGDLAQAADAGKLEDPEVVLTRTPLELDEKGWKKLNKLMAKTLDQALAIASESSARRNDGASAAVFPTELGLLHFKRAEN
jgi:hypothetical protein